MIVTVHVYCIATAVSFMSTACVEEYCRELCSFMGVLMVAIVPLISIVTEISSSIFIAMELLISAVHVNIAVSPTSY